MSSTNKKIKISELTTISHENVLSFDATDPLATQAEKFISRFYFTEFIQNISCSIENATRPLNSYF